MNKLIQEASLEELFAEIQRRRKKQITKDILLGIGILSAISVGMLLAPKFVGTVCRQIYKNDRQYKKDKRKVQVLLQRLRRQELINIEETESGELIVTLTEAGRKRILRYNLDELQIQKADNWDKKWRIVIFDIPESIKQARNAFRNKMKELGFFQLQKSAWVYPCPCKDEIDFISNVFGVGKYLLYFETEKLENEEFLKDYFKLG